jgi:hypothetical protein
VSLWTIDGAEAIRRVAALDLSTPSPWLLWTEVVVVSVESKVPGRQCEVLLMELIKILEN